MCQPHLSTWVGRFSYGKSRLGLKFSTRNQNFSPSNKTMPLLFVMKIFTIRILNVLLRNRPLHRTAIKGARASPCTTAPNFSCFIHLSTLTAFNCFVFFISVHIWIISSLKLSIRKFYFVISNSSKCCFFPSICFCWNIRTLLKSKISFVYFCTGMRCDNHPGDSLETLEHLFLLITCPKSCYIFS
jgi:hypothetical protein